MALDEVPAERLAGAQSGLEVDLCPFRKPAEVRAGDRLRDGVELEVAVLDAPATAALTGLGDSVAVNGCCLTAVSVEAGRIAFDAVPETLEALALG